MIQVENLFHHFGSKAVLDSPSFSVKAGEIAVIMGPNGMGKSTLLSCVGGGLIPRAGMIRIGEHQRYSSPETEMEARKLTMFLPNAVWLPPRRTCRQWAIAVALLYQKDERMVLSHVDDLIKLFDMESVADASMESYSAGQKKKACLIMALAPQTPVLVMDEPFSGGLDPTGLFAIKKLLRLRAEAGTTILISTPTPELVEEVADRIFILREGKITAEGTLEDLRRLAGYEGPLEGIYERLNSSNVEENLSEYVKKHLR